MPTMPPHRGHRGACHEILTSNLCPRITGITSFLTEVEAVAGERFTLATRRGARPFYGSWVEFAAATAATGVGPGVEAETASMTAHFPETDGVSIITKDTSSEESSPA
uniref:Uncharacterized protein n=1 Tax=Leersia perrieri TaxID=77586 RepID=A0A0D9XZI1_9ORYZ